MKHVINSFNEFLNEAEHKAPFDYKSLKIGDTLQKADGSPFTETEDGKKIIVINKGLALLDEKLNWAEIIIVNVLGKEERCTVSFSNLKEIAKHL